MKKRFLIFSLLLLSLSIQAQEKTVVNDAKARTLLSGRHQFSLQWIDFWKYFGTATVTNRNGIFYLKGEQRQRGGSDYVTIDGVVTQIDQKEFKFDGKIVTQVSTINAARRAKETAK